MTIRTVVLVDLAGYSDLQRLFEESLGVSAARAFDAEIQRFIDAALTGAGGSAADNKVMTTGDGALLAFAAADMALDFAARLHEGAATHNRGVTEAQAKRTFRVGAATGPLDIDAQTGALAGMTISRAARLEAKADLGGVLIDPATYEAASPALRAAYRGPETVKGKRDETFAAWRAQVAAASLPPAPHPQSHAQLVLQIDRDMARLRVEQVVLLMTLLDMPAGQRPADTIPLARQGAAILQWAHDGGRLADLADALRGLLGTPEG